MAHAFSSECVSLYYIVIHQNWQVLDPGVEAKRISMAQPNCGTLGIRFIPCAEKTSLCLLNFCLPIDYFVLVIVLHLALEVFIQFDAS